MLTFRRRIGEAFTIGDVRVVRVVVEGRHGLRYEVPGRTPFTVCLGKPRTQQSISVEAEAGVFREEITTPAKPRRVRVFDPTGS